MAGAKGSTEEIYIKSYHDGLEQSLGHGSTTVIDHCRRAEYLLPEAKGSPLRLTTAFEFSGLEESKAAEYFDQVLEIRNRFPVEIRAVSPVGPHSISTPLYELSIEYARKNDLLLCGHLAETEEELEFITDGTGPFVNFLKTARPRDLSDYTPPGCSPIEHLNKLGGLSGNSLAAHCNYLTDRDIEILAKTKTSVAHCPGSYEFFGHTSFRLRDLLEAGVNVCLGTDSLASNDTLSVLQAMRDVRRNHDWLSDEEILRMGTVNGHQALNRGREPTELPIDFCVFPWSGGEAPSKITSEAILHDLLTAETRPVAVIIDGEVVFRQQREG
jgi:cytosine/adenosine deaminase-related metal-dependent hydrolase